MGLAEGSRNAPPLPPGPRDRDPGAPSPGSRAGRLGSPVPSRVLRRARSAQHGRQAPPLPVQPDRDGRPGERRGNRVSRRASRRPLPLPRPARAGRGSPQDGAPRRARTAPGGPGSRADRPARSRLRAGPPQDRGRRPGRGRLQRGLPAVHGESRADLPRQARRDPATRGAGDRAAGRGRPRRGRGHQRRRVHRRRVRPGARRRRAARFANHRRASRDLPREGLQLHVPGQGGRPGADCSGRGRAMARGLVETGRPAPPHLDRGVRGLRPDAHPARLQQHPAAGPRPLPCRGGLGARRVPRVSPADDPGRPAGPGARTPPESLLQRRSRPHGLDDGVRHGPDRDGHDRRAEARARPGRPRAHVRSRVGSSPC